MVARKLCPACRKRLSAAAFNDSAASADGLARLCRACTNARRRKLAASKGSPTHRSSGLSGALRRGDAGVIRKLIRRHAKLPWGLACECLRAGHLELAEELLASSVPHNTFTMAAMADLQGLSRRLKRYPGEARATASSEPATENVTPLHVACGSDWRRQGPEAMERQVRVAMLLMKHGADVNAPALSRGILPATPLFCACWTSGNLKLVRCLLESGARATESDLYAALGHFQRHADPAFELAEILLEWGVPVDGSCPGDRTPLQAFAHQAAHKTVVWLLDHGASVNVRGPGGRTAAHFAAERNVSPRMLAILVDAGADLAARDEDGRTPLDLARLNERPRIVTWIKAQLRRPKR